MFVLYMSLALLAAIAAMAASEEGDGEGFELKRLPYSFSALEPAIDKQTMELHWGRHHRAYTDNMNAALKTLQASETVSKRLRKQVKKALASKDLSVLEDAIHLAMSEEETHGVETAALRSLRNNGGGYLNHNQYWENLAAASSQEKLLARTELDEAIAKTFGSVEEFQAKFIQQGLSVFGSGWVWLVYNVKSKALEIVTTPNQDLPSAHLRVILACDVWEHAYYLKRQNLRVDYLKAFFTVVDHKAINARFLAARHGKHASVEEQEIVAMTS